MKWLLPTITVALIVTGFATAGQNACMSSFGNLGGPDRFSQNIVVRNLFRVEKLLDLKSEVMPDVPPAIPIADQPIDTFLENGDIIQYATMHPQARDTRDGLRTIFFGKKLPGKTPEQTEDWVRRQFSRGTARPPGHRDIAVHQRSNSGAANSGFSNGSELFSVGRLFAEGNGVVLIVDTTGQDVINAWEWTNRYPDEREILTLGGRSPDRIQAAVIYQNGRPTKIHRNPNFHDRAAEREEAKP